MEENPNNSNSLPIPNPPDSVELGRNSWSLLHSIAAAYPERPSSDQQFEMRSFLNAFSKFYPCEVCADDFQDVIRVIPPRVNSRLSLSMWMCDAHNEVNRRLGKPTMNCPLFVKNWMEEVHGQSVSDQMLADANRASQESSSSSNSSSSNSNASATSGNGSNGATKPKSTTCGTTFCTLDKFKKSFSNPSQPPSS